MIGSREMDGWIISLGHMEDVDQLSTLYDDLNDFLAAGENGPGWLKGVYPIRETAEEGINVGELYVIRSPAGTLAGSIILSHEPESAYGAAVWPSGETDYRKVSVIRTLVAHPAFIGQGVGRRLLKFAEMAGREQGLRCIRLDVAVQNAPAIALYERCGYTYVDKVDLGLGEQYPHLVWFRLYEKEL